jgi:hypothetical protein
MTGVGERERGESWTGLVQGRAGPAGSRVWPKWAAGFFLLFFYFLFSFLLFQISVLVFLKKLFYSDLNKNKADHFCPLKSVFETYKPRVW